MSDYADIAATISEFMADPSKGPRVYQCPKCEKIYYGKTDVPYYCGTFGNFRHDAEPVIELARRDSRDPVQGPPYKITY